MKLDLLAVLMLYVMAATVFFIIDLIWLGIVAKTFYAKHIGALLRDQVIWPAALIFYAVYIGGILLFVVAPSLRHGSGILQTALLGGALGCFAYATFDLTCLALLRQWSVIISVVDIAWGTLLTGATCAATVWLARILPGIT